jgi:hypothetical protein
MPIEISNTENPIPGSSRSWSHWVHIHTTGVTGDIVSWKMKPWEQKLQDAIVYLDTDTNASPIWKLLSHEERTHISSLIENAIKTGSDLQIHMLYGAIDLLKQAGIGLTERDIHGKYKIHSLSLLYKKATHTNQQKVAEEKYKNYRDDLFSFLQHTWTWYAHLDNDAKNNFAEELLAIIKREKSWKQLHACISRLLDEYKLENLYNIQFTKSWLISLDQRNHTTHIGSLESYLYPYEIYMLNTKSALTEESSTLKHCVGESDVYIEKIKEWKSLIFSLREKNVPMWTIEYDTKTRSILQFRGFDNASIGSIPRDELFELVTTTLDTLRGSWYQVDHISEVISYSLIRNTTSGRYEMNSDDLYKKVLSWDYHVLKWSLVCNIDTTQEDIEKLSQILGLTLDLTHLPKHIKSTIQSIQWNLIDHSGSINYTRLNNIWGNVYLSNILHTTWLENLMHIWGNANFSSIWHTDGLINLESIWGNASFGKLTDAEGLENLKNIWGNADFSKLTNAEGLRNLRYIGGVAHFWSLISATWLENLQHIWGGARFQELIYAKWLRNLKNIWGNADFDHLIDATWLENLQKIWRAKNFFTLSDEEKMKIPAFQERLR